MSDNARPYMGARQTKRDQTRGGVWPGVNILEGTYDECLIKYRNTLSFASVHLARSGGLSGQCMAGPRRCSGQSCLGQITQKSLKYRNILVITTVATNTGHPIQSLLLSQNTLQRRSIHLGVSDIAPASHKHGNLCSQSLEENAVRDGTDY